MSKVGNSVDALYTAYLKKLPKELHNLTNSLEDRFLPLGQKWHDYQEYLFVGHFKNIVKWDTVVSRIRCVRVTWKESAHIDLKLAGSRDGKLLHLDLCSIWNTSRLHSTARPLQRWSYFSLRYNCNEECNQPFLFVRLHKEGSSR